MKKKAKQKIYICENCGHEHSQWVGQCQNCHQWNTVVEVKPLTVNSKSEFSTSPQPLSEVSMRSEKRISSNIKELDRVLGGGMVPGAVHLIGGEPGIGKSTLMLQLALSLSQKKVLYVSGEESNQQIRMRAERLTGELSSNCFVSEETNTSTLFKQIAELKPELIVVDSIQTMQSLEIENGTGSISQIRQVTSEFIQFAKRSHVPVFIIGHITKEGTIAGPKILEHMVDVVLQFEGDRNHLFRILRGQKNRFGATSELGIFEIEASGLKEVTNPSVLLLSGARVEGLSGNATGVTMEGVRPMLVEVQALVSSAVYGTPQRTANGFDNRRLNMLLAVLEKRAGFPLGSKDVFLNITGGIKIEDPAIDLAVIVAILSSAVDIPIDRKICFAAEVGLSGELRPVIRTEQRIAEASKLGYRQIISSQTKKSTEKKSDIELISLKKVEELRDFLFV